MPSREENISSLALWYIPHNLAPKYIGCQAKRQRVQWDSRRVQLHPSQPPGYGPGGERERIKGKRRYTSFFSNHFLNCFFQKLSGKRREEVKEKNKD